ncbi:MAG: hypothetical protein EB150_07065 [Nitrososphaeria archaeon]|nr:hypothetical protein [Nitrososphaeria archaeon]NDB51929.1 hypothetical protein [Nitrosopumilaceae archaeon]NDB88606.1 hypothetical protein [Nitrososphaerota archaeon]NDB47149.1 hypothetical protein [Nitrososphaeria archaeon]NDB62810.1 hypothetical protein [Nitrosopumilaceae archaeon]
MKINSSFDNFHWFNNSGTCFDTVVEKENENEKMKKKTEQEEMKDESHQLELKEGYEQDENYDESAE